MRRTRWLRVALAAVAVCAALVEPASAHQQFNNRKDGIIGGQAGFCVHGNVVQNHTWHEITTFRVDCNNVRNTWHAQYQEYYKTFPWGQPGQFCFGEGWHQSNHQAFFTMHYPWDIWHWCNNGINVNVWISIDSWQYSWHDQLGYLGGWWRPATNHCHCP